MSLEAILHQLQAPTSPPVIEAQGLAPKDLITALEQAGYFATLVDRAPVFSKETLLHALYQACEMPAYFGFNWDALLEVLSDWEWKEARGYVLVFQHFDTLQGRAPETAQIFLEIVREAHEGRNTPLWLIQCEPLSP